MNLEETTRFYYICTFDGFEVGYGEIKPPNTRPNEEKEDRCWVPEHLKKQNYTCVFRLPQRRKREAPFAH